jgi:hypothetical protein
MRFPSTLPLLFVVLAVSAASAAAFAAETDPPAKPLPRITDADVIAKAVRETLAEEPAAPRKPDGGPLRADPYGSFRRQFSDAEIPGCLRPDGLKFQPPKIGPIGLGGIFALPFLAAAVVRGKCH